MNHPNRNTSSDKKNLHYSCKTNSTSVRAVSRLASLKSFSTKSKFNIVKLISKIESEKALILESNHKSAKHLAHRVDNRKLLAMERLRDPSKDPEIRSALLIAARVLNINIED